MRTRAKVTKVSDFVRDPDMRIVFQKEHHPDFLKLIAIGDEYAINPTTLSRHLILIFIRKMNNAEDKQTRDRIITEVMQSIHGLFQIDMFHKPINPGFVAVKGKAIPKAEAKKLVTKKKGGKKK